MGRPSARAKRFGVAPPFSTGGVQASSSTTSFPRPTLPRTRPKKLVLLTSSSFVPLKPIRRSASLSWGT
jgi:hypothetical protein